MKVREIFQGDPPTAAPDESAASAWERMNDIGVDHLVVLNEDEITGVLSRHDLGGPSGGTHRRMGRRVADLMRRDVITTSPNANVRRASALMRRHKIGCLPVVERGRLVGLVTRTDLLALLERLLR
jgi:CBS domain-containing protein